MSEGKTGRMALLLLWLCLLVATLTDGQLECSQQDSPLMEGEPEIAVCVVYTPLLDPNGRETGSDINITATIMRGTEDAMLVDSLAQRVDGTLANYCVALQTVDDQFIEQSEEIVVEFVADSRILAKEQCSLMIEDDDDASVTCGRGLLIVFEDEGTAQFCGTITRSGEVDFAVVEATIISLNGQFTKEGIVDLQEDDFCVNVTIPSDEIVERTERFLTEIVLISEGNDGNLEEVDGTNCEVLLVIDDDSPYLECTPVNRLVIGGSTGENIRQFCIADSNAFQFVDMCMDMTLGSNDCSHWTPDTYAVVTELADATQLQILHSYIPFSTNVGCLDSVSMFLRTLYQLDATSVGPGSCIVDCVLTIEANSCRRAYLLLENVPVTMSSNPSSVTTPIQAMCNSMPSVNIEVNFQCCQPPSGCSFSETPSLPVTSHQPFPPSITPTLAATPLPLTSQPSLPMSPQQRPRVVNDSVPQAAIIGAAVGGIAVLVLTIIVTLVLVVICRKHRNTASTMKDGDVASPKHVVEGAFSNPVYTFNKGVVYANELVYEEITNGERGQQNNQSDSARNNDKWKEVFAGKILQQSQVEYLKPIGEGAFGRIYKGRIITPAPGRSSDSYAEVAIKTLKKVTSDQEVEDFIAESAIMLDFHHPNVLSLVGVIFDTTDHLPVIVLPFMTHGDLRSFLKSKRTRTSSTSSSTDTLPTELTEKTLVEMCLDIAKGMQYLTTRKFVHRDLAARNCMVDEALSVKVADFGMSRDVFHSDYYRLTHKARLPVKWMPPESIFNNIFNEKTDVWSFGVTCWEVFSLGRKPFPGIDNVDIPEFISSGHRLKKPTLCSSEMYDIMIDTWNDRPEDRPTFEKLVTSLARLCQSTGDLNHHYHILDAPAIPVGERNTAPDAPYHVLEGPTVPASGSTGNAPTNTVESGNATSEPQYHVLEGPTANPVSGITCIQNEHHYAVLEGPTANAEITYTAVKDIDNQAGGFPNE